MALIINGTKVAGRGKDGIGIAPGGEAGQVLAKKDNTDYTSEWISLPAFGSLSSKDEVEKTDLSEDVQELLNKAESSVQPGNIPKEVYVGDGNMPENATIQILMDGSDEELALKDELKEYINEELADKVLKSESEIYYYTTVSGAIADIEADTTENAITDTDEACVKVFTSCDGVKTVMLFKDLLETAQISTTKNLNLNLGGHTLTINSSVAYVPLSSEMICISNGNIVIDITNGVQYSSLITFWGKHVIMDNINLKVFGGTSQLIAGIYATNNNGVYDIKNCNITVSNSLESAVAIYNNQGTLNIENTVIKADTDSATNSIGITNKSRLTIVESTIFADAPDNSTDRNGLSIGIHNYGTLYSINTDVCGTHSGMQNEGNVCIYGGTYESCSHGGLYLVANGKGKIFVKDATIACSDYTGTHDASAFSNSKLAALYFGSSSNSNGEIAYFDGCTIDATGADHVMVLRKSNGDDLNVFNISNSTISDGENYIRMDGATVKLNIGKGTNITTNRLPSGANYEYTNEFYRKYGRDAEIKGRDINLVLATCVTKNELDKIPNQVINILETNAIEQIPAKNLFNKNNYKALKAYVNSTGKTLTSASEATTVYIPIEANQVYTVSKIASKRFAVGVTDSEMIANGTTFTETIQTNTATSITISTGANSKNLAVFCHVSSADTLTVEEILDTLQIEKGDTATGYEAWHEPTYNAVDKVARENVSEAIKAALTQAKESGEFDGADGDTPQKGTDYWTEADRAEIIETIKTEVPLVKVAEQPTFVDSIDKMTDTSKVYVMIPDGDFYAYMKGAASHRFTAADFTYCQTDTDGSLMSAYLRIATANLVDLSKGTVSIYCPEPYQYFIYYYTDNDESTYIGKTAWKSGNIDDVLTDTIASGTINGAKYCRISLRDGTSANANLNGRIDEFIQNVIVTQMSSIETYDWQKTGFSYNQPADYEDRIVALEQALGGIIYGSY